MNYMQEAENYAKHSTCLKRQVGCVVVKDGKIVAYGFNHGYTEPCTCSMNHKNPNVIHAEQMALQGICDIYKDADLYVTYQPCDQCAKLIIDKKIKQVFYSLPSNCSNSLQYLNQHRVSTHLLN